MNFCSSRTLFIILIISIAIFSQAHVEATRVLSEDFTTANHPSVYDKTKYTIGCWLQRLASGPSPRGPGH
ncbi:hypothetical protein L1049_021635 [Liquidambar formosana]|uniref:Transmembrane protein n=1 Tax=Liquidambar formosana TaxID=63359 RepID=A0AAP0N7Q7_LIQFO